MTFSKAPKELRAINGRNFQNKFHYSHVTFHSALRHITCKKDQQQQQHFQKIQIYANFNLQQNGINKQMYEPNENPENKYKYEWS